MDNSSVSTIIRTSANEYKIRLQNSKEFFEYDLNYVPSYSDLTEIINEINEISICDLSGFRNFSRQIINKNTDILRGNVMFYSLTSTNEFIIEEV